MNRMKDDKFLVRYHLNWDFLFELCFNNCFWLLQALETPAKVHDKTPLLDTTNKSNKSSISMKGMTPLSLKKVMTRAFRKNKNTYNVKKNLDTPLKTPIKTPLKRGK